jgi:apolipoprotein N-acyltransferase
MASHAGHPPNAARRADERLAHVGGVHGCGVLVVRPGHRGLHPGRGPIGLAVLLLLAPFFQPQFLAFSLVRHLAGKRHGPAVRALAAAAAWVGAEWALPKVLGDTLGYGLYPSAVMRQFADLGGSAGLTVLLLLANEGFALAWARRAGGWRKVSKPMALRRAGALA